MTKKKQTLDQNMSIQIIDFKLQTTTTIAAQSIVVMVVILDITENCIQMQSDGWNLIIKTPKTMTLRLQWRLQMIFLKPWAQYCSFWGFLNCISKYTGLTLNCGPRPQFSTILLITTQPRFKNMQRIYRETISHATLLWNTESRNNI